MVVPRAGAVGRFRAAGMGTGRLVDLLVSAGIPIPADIFANELSTCVSSGAEDATMARSRCSVSTLIRYGSELEG